MEGAKLLEALSSEDFDLEKYVNTLTVEGDDGLLEGRQKLQALSDETKRALKRNVYENYLKFIDAAKEIYILEGEMYQLNHMLTEQKNMMTYIMENSIASDKVEMSIADEEDSRKNLAFLMEKVEGCSHVMEVSGRHLVHDGDVVELEVESFAQLQKCHMFLLNDSLMLASWQANPNKRGPIKYKFLALYELDSLAIVNVRDVGPVKNAFKVLMFPDTRIYQVDNPKAKRQWLEYLEEVKKKKAAKDKARREALAAAEKRDMPSPLGETNPSNPFEEESDQLISIEGLKEVPEDLDVLIAQRDFEGAVDQIYEVNAKLQEVMVKSPVLREYSARVDQRVKQLTDILMQELLVSPERTMRAGTNSARTAVTQLIRLGKSAQACQLFLKNRSTVIRYNMRQLKIEGATNLYIRRLCEMFFGTLQETCKEFYKAFPSEFYGCFSGVIVWAREELEAFVEVYKRQVFGSKSGIPTIAECVGIARTSCIKLQDVGLDLEFIFNSLISEDVERCALDHTNNFLLKSKQRAEEDNWQPMQFTHRNKLNSLLDTMINAGFTDIESLVYDGLYISLTENSLTFCRTVILFLDDLCKLNQPSIQYLVDSGVQQVWSSQISHIEKSLNSALYMKENKNKFILKNAAWLEEKVLAVAEARYLDSVGYPSTEMKHMHRSFGKLKSLAMAYQAELV
ncbi:exocyst complex component 8-like [Watersipora subatra]|uniref:exocyst complex component 8-like n=1 Tax=Watersipora subatra TaxID=2589382 RepID=UPI00355BFBA8